MYCIHCGVHLDDAMDSCPLCGTAVCHPDYPKTDKGRLYPKHKMPRVGAGRRSLCGAILLLFCIPLLVCLYADLQGNGRIDWFGFALGGTAVAYVAVALPMWFAAPNPVIFVPCAFLTAALYLGHIAMKTGGEWYWTFGLPVTGGLCLLVTTAVTLLRYVPRGKWFIWGGIAAGAGVYTVLIEWLLSVAFDVPVIGWSVYPLVALTVTGGLLIWFGVSAAAREAVYRRLFF